MEKRLTAFSVLIFLLLFSLVSFSEENNPRLRVINNNSPLNTKYGEVLLPKGTIVNSTDKSEDGFTVTTEVFGAEVSGTIQAKLVEPFETASPAANAADKKHAASQPSAAETEKKETVQASIKYMGKIRDPEFIDYLYENIKDTFVFQNLISKELCTKDKIPTIDSIDDCAPLKDGDFLILKGYYSGKIDGKSAIIHIFNESHTVMSQPALVFLSDKSEAREEAYKRLVVYSPNSEVQDPLKAGVKYIFREVGSSKIIISKEDFIKMIEAGKEFQFKCLKCEGKGKRKEAGKEKKCTYCKGTGFLSPEATLAAAERDYKKAK